MLKTFCSALIALAFSSAAVAQTLPLQPGKWKMYSLPNVTPSDFCDVHQILTLDKGTLTGEFGLLEQGLNGVCEIYVPRNARFFNVVFDTTECGSQIWLGEIETLDARYEVKVLDHRTRLCDDLVPALIVAELKDSSTGETSKLYSHQD